MSTRTIATTVTADLGERLHNLKEDLLKAGYIYNAGILRGAEEALQLVYNSLKDTNITEQEL